MSVVRTPPDSPAAWSATEVTAAIRSGEVRCEDVVRACLERIAERDGEVHAWTHVDPERALVEARRRDATPVSGPLHGLPVGVKDLIDTADAPTGYGSPIYSGHRPARDAACVTRLRDAGAVVLGKTVTTEFALFQPGPTANPHDPGRTPGGSSSGSAAAVADHMVPVALGTQTAGSIVRPASFCGIYGYKPTFGAVPTEGVKAIGPSLDTVGPLARTVDDLAVTAAVLRGVPVRRPANQTPSIAFARTWEWDRADAATRDAIDGLATHLQLPEVTLPGPYADLVEVQTTIMESEAAQALAPELRTHPEQLSAQLRELLARGAAISDDVVRRARDHAARCRDLLPSVFADHDVLVVPSAVGEAPEGLGATGDPLFCRIWTLLGTPAVAIPGLRGPHGMPLGVQVVADRDDDAIALAAGRAIGARLAEQVP